MRFDPATYPGRRPDGPALVYAGEVWPLGRDGPTPGPEAVAPAARGAPVLQEPAAVRWCVAYGSNACPDRLVDKGLDARGALLLPAAVQGWATAWEARRSTSTGAVPLTLVAAPGRRLDAWVLGVHPGDTGVLDTSESRGHHYLLGQVGATAVAARYLLAGGLAYGPGRTTRVLADRGSVCTHPDRDQAGAGALVDSGDPVTLRAEPLPGLVAEGWPPTPLADLDLFVYGTLQPGQQRWGAVADHVEVVGDAAARGSLVATYYGWPAARFDGTGTVHGVVLRPRGPDEARELYARADELEGAPDLFQRVPVRVTVAGRAQWAAAYAWNPAQGEPPGQPVPTGRWSGADGG